MTRAVELVELIQRKHECTASIDNICLLCEKRPLTVVVERMKRSENRTWDRIEKWLNSVRIDSFSIGGLRFGFRSELLLAPAYQRLIDKIEEGKSRATDVFVLSAHNMDEVYSIDRIASDHECKSTIYKNAPGGSGANTAYALSALGRRIAVSGVVGDDDTGKELLAHLRECDVDISLIECQPGPSGATVTIVEDSGRRLIVVREGVNREAGKCLDLQKLVAQARSSRVFHSSSFVSESCVRLQEEALRLTVDAALTTLTPGALYSRKGLDGISKILRSTNVLFLYKEQLVELIEKSSKGAELRGKSNQELANTYFSWKRNQGFKIAQAIVIKDPLKILGGKLQDSFISVAVGDTELEVYLASTSLERDIPYTAIDTTGAGDASAAGFIHALLNLQSPSHAVDSAFVLAAFASTQYGARTAFDIESSRDNSPTLSLTADRIQAVRGD